MRFSIVPPTFPGDPRAEDLLAIFDDVLRHCERRFGPIPESRPVNVSYAPGDYPRMWADDHAILMELTAEDRKWSLYALQSAYFICGLAVGLFYRKKGSRWFAVACTAAASHEIVRDMAYSWRTEPPFARWAPYARELENFAIILKCLHPAVADFSRWIEANELRFQSVIEFDEALGPAIGAIADELAALNDWRSLRQLPDSDLPASAFLPLWRALATSGGD